MTVVPLLDYLNQYVFPNYDDRPPRTIIPPGYRCGKRDCSKPARHALVYGDPDRYPMASAIYLCDDHLGDSIAPDPGNMPANPTRKEGAVSEQQSPTPPAPTVPPPGQPQPDTGQPPPDTGQPQPDQPDTGDGDDAEARREGFWDNP